jgi:ferric-dicitrate binding protein FerR (iron transport regulator)
VSERLDLALEAYHDGTLDAAGAELLLTALRGPEAATTRERLAFTGLLGQIFTSEDAVLRSIEERIEAEGSASRVVRAVQRSIGGPRRRGRRSPPMVVGRIAAAAAVVTIIGLGWLIHAEQRQPAVECRIEIAGDLLVQRGARRLPAQPGMGLMADDRLAAAAPAILAWADGSRITLAAGSRVVVGRPGAGQGIQLEQGDLSAEIRTRPAGSPFSLSTPEAQVDVLGTRFDLHAGTGRTTCDLHRGSLRIARRSDGLRLDLAAGHGVTVADGTPLVARPLVTAPPVVPVAPTTASSAGSWTALFPGDGLVGWEQQHGRWSNTGGTVRGSDPDGSGKARILSARTFTDVELTCRLRITDAGFAEVQVGDYNWFVEVPARGTEWIALRLVQRGSDLRVSADGIELKLQPGAGAAMRPGPLAFYVMPGGTLEISEARFRIPPQP